MNKIDKNVIGTLALAEGMLQTMKKQVKAKTPIKIIDRCQTAISDVWEMLPDPTKAERYQVSRKIKRMGNLFDELPLQKLHLVIVSMLLALVDTAISQKAPQPGSVKKLNILLTRLFSLQKYYDPKLKYHKCYQRAEWLSEQWSRC